MKPYVSLYCRGHRVTPALIIVFCIGIVLVACEGWLLNIPWLNGAAGVNIGTLCSFSYATLPALLFRNQISRLEAQVSRTWPFIDTLVLVILWSIPWLFSLSGISSLRFAYVSTLLMGISVFAGRFMNVCTLALVLVLQLVLQTALWPSLSSTPWRHVMFALDTPSSCIALLLSGLLFFVSVVSLRKFKGSTS